MAPTPENSLRSRLIRLASTRPDLRPHLLPLLREAASETDWKARALETVARTVKELGDRSDPVVWFEGKLEGSYRSPAVAREGASLASIHYEEERGRRAILKALSGLGGRPPRVSVEESEKAWFNVSVEF